MLTRDEILEKAKAAGIKVLYPSLVIDPSDNARTLRDGIFELLADKDHGTFKAVRSLSAYGVLTLLGLDKDENADEMSEDLRQNGEALFEVPEGHKWDCGSVLAFWCEPGNSYPGSPGA